VGLAAPWGSATMSIGTAVRGSGTFTLWHITVSTEVFGLTVSEKFSIDDDLCGGIVTLSQIDETCNKFSEIRIFLALAMLFAFVAFGCSLAALLVQKHKIAKRATAFAAAALSAFASASTVAALLTALSMQGEGNENPYLDEISVGVGAGSVCTGLLVVSALAAAVLEVRYWCVLRSM